MIVYHPISLCLIWPLISQYCEANKDCGCNSNNQNIHRLTGLTLMDYQAQLQPYIENQNPDATVGDTLRMSSIKTVVWEF
jgi:hypothetical protein